MKKNLATFTVLCFVFQTSILYAEGAVPVSIEGLTSEARTISASEEKPVTANNQETTAPPTPMDFLMGAEQPLSAVTPATPVNPVDASIPGDQKKEEPTAAATPVTMTSAEDPSVTAAYNASAVRAKELRDKMAAAKQDIAKKKDNLAELEKDPKVDKKALQEYKNHLADPKFLKYLTEDLENLNKALAALDEARKTNDLAKVKAAAAQVDSYYGSMTNAYVNWSAITDVTLADIKKKLEARAVKLIFKQVVPYVAPK